MLNRFERTRYAKRFVTTQTAKWRSLKQATCCQQSSDGVRHIALSGKTEGRFGM